EREERRGAFGGSQPSRTLGDREPARQTSGLRVRSGVQEQGPATGPRHEQHRMEERTGASRREVVRGTPRAGARGLQESAGARPQAHVRTAAKSRGRLLRGSSGSARTQERTHHNTLLTGGALEADRGIGEGLRLRVPQKPRNDLAAEK